MNSGSTSKRRFCMVTTFYPPYSFGGDGVFVHRLSNELAKRGHEVEVVHCADAYRFLAGGEPTEGPENHPGVRIHTLRSPFGVLSPLATQQTGYPVLKRRALKQVLEGRGFDVIHFHNISLIGGPAVLGYGDAIKLYTLHEHWLVCPMHTLWRYNKEVCSQTTCVRCTLAYKRPPQLWRYGSLLRNSIKHVDAFLAPTQFTLEQHRSRGLEAPVFKLGNFLPQSEPVASNGGEPAATPPHRKPYFLFVGRLEALKGVQTLLPLFRGEDGPDLLIAGEGRYGNELRRMAADSPRIQWLGNVPFAHARRLMHGALALICPSIGYETFCMVVIEALANGTPVIGRDLGGIGEIVAESGGGLLYRNDDELIEAMARLESSPSLRSTLVARGRETYEEKWTADVHLRNYIDLIDRLDDMRRTSRAGDEIPTLPTIPSAIRAVPDGVGAIDPLNDTGLAAAGPVAHETLVQRKKSA